jgi:hypothetical protein
MSIKVDSEPLKDTTERDQAWRNQVRQPSPFLPFAVFLLGQPKNSRFNEFVIHDDGGTIF